MILPFQAEQRHACSFAHLSPADIVPERCSEHSLWRLQASALAHEVAGNRMGAAQSMDAPLGLQRHLTVPLFATSAVTGSGIPLLHAFLASLRSTAQPAASALVRHHPLADMLFSCVCSGETSCPGWTCHSPQNLQVAPLESAGLHMPWCLPQGVTNTIPAVPIPACSRVGPGGCPQPVSCQGRAAALECADVAPLGVHGEASAPLAAQDGQDGQEEGLGAQGQLLSACSPLEPAASEASYSEAYSMFALSLDNDSCRSPEGFTGMVPPAERPRKKLYLPEHKPLTHFQVCSWLT